MQTLPIKSALLVSFLCCLILPGAAACVGVASGKTAPMEFEETLLLQEPTLSAEHIVFRHAEDLWIVPRSGGDARRLTSSLGRESSPQLSPDGKHVAFSGQYEGNTDVYVIGIDGGAPRRLTWHPDRDVVLDWTPDGQSVVFRSSRFSSVRTSRAFRVDLEGGTPTGYALPKVHHASLDADGSHFAYTPIADAFATWKRYRGGRLAKIWLFDRETHEVQEVPHGNANDTFPGWLGGDVYFASDRDGVMNLFRFSPGGSQLEQLTHFTEFHIRSMDTGHGAVVFEQAGALHLFDPARNSAQRLSIRVRTDGLAAAPRWQSVKGHVRSADVAPNGKRAVFEARGEIITVPKEYGDSRNLTRSPGAHDRSPAWSPDGEEIAWFSDRGGEYHLVVQDRLGREEARTFELGGVGFYYSPQWSPNGEHVLFVDKGNRLAFVTLASGEVTQVASVQGSLGVVFPSAVWSPDSKWIAFENRNARTLYDHVALFELATGQVSSVTDDFAVSASPAFSRDGKHLFFSASVNRGPAMMGLNMATSTRRDWNSHLYVAVLKADGDNPLFPKSDDGVDGEGEEEEDGEEDEKENEGADEEDGAAKEGDDETDDETVDEGPSIDLDGLDQRILALPVASGNYWGLACTDDKLYFIESPRSGPRELKRFDFESKKAKSLKTDVSGFTISGDGKSLLLSGKGYSIAGPKAEDGKSIDIDSVMVHVEPRLEWPQILREVWRIQRDYFYDSNMHGVDWDAMWVRWQPFLAHVKHRADLTVIVQELIGELACGHQYVRGGESAGAPQRVSVGLLGADFEVAHGRYRIANILEGQNWNPGQRAPLTEPGVEVAIGDFLLAVNGQPLSAEHNLYKAFENTAGKQVDLTVSARADGAHERTVTVVPISNERTLRFNSWVEANRKRVDELSGGRLAYIYMPNTSTRGRNAFDRDFYSQLDKHGLILDERYNGGGMVADYVIETLSRNVVTLWRNREEWLAYSPSGVMEGPKVMIVNEYAGSGGDWMPWAFQNQGIGKLVGTRTWGGLVGISGYPTLVDGGTVTAANFGVMNTEGEWIVENVGVAPDVEVIEWPKYIIAGGDPQLEMAVKLALEELERQPRRPDPEFKAPVVR